MLCHVSEIASPLVSGLLPLVGVAVGAWATVAVRRSTTRAERERFVAESRAAHRAEVKSAALDYLAHAQRLQGGLDARERGKTPTDLKRLVEQLWLAEKAVEIICSDALRDQLIAHARGLHRVLRHAVTYPDWWASCALLAGGAADTDQGGAAPEPRLLIRHEGDVRTSRKPNRYR